MNDLRVRCSAVLLLVCLYSGAFCTAVDDRIKDENEALQTRFNLFDGDLLKELSKSNSGNFLVSPASIKTLLALVLEAADGTTFTEIRNLLRLSDNITDARMQLGDLQSALQRSMSSRVIVDCVAQAFVSKALVTNNTYTQIIKEYYDADVNRQDFNQPQIVTNYINSWINTRTRGLIPTLLDQNFINRETLSILVSAVYFDGKWKNEFQRRNTRSRCFYPEPNMNCQLTPMMIKTEELFYRFDAALDAHVLQIPYQEERFFMVIVLPFKKDGIKQLDLDSSRLVFPALIQNMKLLDVNLTMPRFSMEFETELPPVLKQMGLNEVFSPKAKLPYIFNNKQGKISEMIHKAVIEVTEKGTKAAAGSGASVVPLMHSLDSISLELNRPFYYFVCEGDTQAILFMGRLSTMEETGDQDRVGTGSDSALEPLQPNNQLITSGRVPQQPANKPNFQMDSGSTAHVSHGALNYPYDPAQSSSTTRSAEVFTGVVFQATVTIRVNTTPVKTSVLQKVPAKKSIEGEACR